MEREGLDERAIVGFAGLALVGLAAFFLLLGERDPPGGVVTGRVITASGQIPWRYDQHAQMVARWEDPQSGRSRSARTQMALDGRYRLTGLPEDLALQISIDWRLTFSMEYVAPPAKYGIRSGARNIDFVLRPGARIEGRVVERDGSTPRARYLVYARSLNAAFDYFGTVCETSEEGRFLLRGLPAGSHVVRVRTNPYTEDTRESPRETWIIVHKSVQEAGSKDVRLVLPKRRNTKLRVLHERVKWAGTIWLFVAGTTEWVGHWQFYDDLGPPDVLRLLPVGQRYTLVVLPDYDDCVGFGQDVQAGDSVTLSLGPTKPLAGRIRRPAGDPRPVLGSVYAISKLTCFHMWIDDGGRFEAENGIYPGRYEIRYRFANGTEQVLARNVKAGRTDLDLVLR